MVGLEEGKMIPFQSMLLKKLKRVIVGIFLINQRKRDIRKWEKENNVVLGIWTITNQTEKMTNEDLVNRRRPWIVPPRDPKETEGKHFIFMLLGFPPETYNHEEELENIEKMNAMKIPEEGHFYPIVDIQRFACKNGHTRFLCYNCLRGFEREETLERHKENCYEFHKVPENVPKRPIHFHDYRVLRPVPVEIGFDTEAFNRVMS